MAPGSMQYTLVGFSAELDWRPLRFVKPLPPKWVCGACGLVRPKTALLSCMHVLCESCYDQCGQEGIHVCPVDNYENQDGDVEWRELAADDLLRREVKCWNDESGCQQVTAASGIAQHFLHGCGHHSICCVKCSATVLCSGVIAHMKSECCNSGTALASDRENKSDFTEEETFSSTFRGGFKNDCCEMKEFMARIVGDIGTINDRLNEISHGINRSKEILRDELKDLTRQNIESLMQTTSEVNATSKQVEFLLGSIDGLNVSANIRLEKELKEELAKAASETRDHMSQIFTAIESTEAARNENCQKALDKVEKILLHVQLGVSHCYFFVKDFESLQEAAMKEGWANYEDEPVYLRGYRMSPGVYLSKEEDSLRLRAVVMLYKGDMDDAVPWPFEHRIKLTLIHPKDGGERVIDVKPFRAIKCFQRPKISSDSAYFFPDHPLDVKSLISDGYVENNQLRAKWEVLP